MAATHNGGTWGVGWRAPPAGHEVDHLVRAGEPPKQAISDAEAPTRRTGAAIRPSRVGPQRTARRTLVWSVHNATCCNSSLVREGHGKMAEHVSSVTVRRSAAVGSSAPAGPVRRA
jgi:hypothetical protein